MREYQIYKELNNFGRWSSCMANSKIEVLLHKFFNEIDDFIREAISMEI